MAWFRLTAPVILLFLSFASSMSAEPERFLVRSAFVDPSGHVSAVVELPPGASPEPSDFQLIVDENPVTTARETRGQELNVMFFIDVSGSMKGSPLNDAKSALLNFLRKARKQDQFALTTFADEDKLKSSFEDPRQQINESVGKLNTEGKQTRLYQALDNALKRGSRDDQRTRRIFVVISDGKDEGSEVTLEQVIADSKASLVPIYAVYRGKTEPPFRAILDLLANAAGGKYFFTRNRRELADTLDTIYDLEKSSLVVRFNYPVDKGGAVADNAGIALKRPDGSVLTAKFPLSVPVPAGPRWNPFTLWAIGIILALFICAWALWYWNRPEKKPVEEPIFIPPEPEPEPAPEPPSPSRRATTVIGQYFPIPTAAQPAAMLRGVAGPIEGQEYSVDKEIFSIGASSENDLSIGEDEFISREHAYLRYEKGSLFIFDKASRNGTFVNDDKVAQNGVVLHPGDHVRVGASTFEIVMPSS